MDGFTSIQLLQVVTMHKSPSVWLGLLPLLLVLASAQSQKVRICYFANWAQYREPYAKFVPSDIDPFLCTHIIYAFAAVDVASNTIQTTEINDLELYEQATDLRIQNPDLKVLLALGGYGHGTERFIAVANSSANTDVFAQNAVTWLRRYHFDGLDIGWEWPDWTTRAIFQNFVQRIRSAFDAEVAATGNRRLLLTVDANADPDTVSIRYGPSVIAPYVDYIHIMAYEFFGNWDTVLAHHSPLYARTGRLSMHQSVQAFLNSGAPRNKLVLGFSTYGRAVKLYSAEQKNLGDSYTRQWASAGRFTQTPGFLAYYEICENLAQGWTKEFTDVSSDLVAYDSNTMEWVCYDEPEGFAAKAKYVLDENLAGAMVWSLDLDDFSSNGCGLGPYPLTSTIKRVFEEKASPRQNAGTTNTAPSQTTSPQTTTTTQKTTARTSPPTPRIMTTTRPDRIISTTRLMSTTTIVPSTSSPLATTTTISRTTMTRTSPSTAKTPIATTTAATATKTTPFSTPSNTSISRTTAEPSLKTTIALEATTKPIYTGGSYCPTRWGFYAHPEDCHRFISCMWGAAIQFTCGPYMHFSEMFSVCTWPSADCNKGKGPA